MSKVSLGGSSTGTATFDIVAPATNTNRTITLPDSSGQVSVLDLRTAVSATGTAIDFTNIPATARRITVMFSGVSTNGTSPIIVQIGDSGGIENTSYSGSAALITDAAAVSVANNSSGFLIISPGNATFALHGNLCISNINGNEWSTNHSVGLSTTARAGFGGGSKTLSDTLTQLRITTVNGTDQFDAGTINILVE